MPEKSDFEDLDKIPRSLDDNLMKLLAAEYDDLAASLRANEELGERRLDVYLTLIAAVTAAIGLASSRFEDDISPLVATASVAAALMFVFGVMTLRRIMVRNVMTSAYMNGLRRIRAFFSQGHPEGAQIFTFPPERAPITRTRKSRIGIGNAGILETVAAINCVLGAITVAGTSWLLDISLEFGVSLGALGGAALWAAQMEWTNRTYDRLTKKNADERADDLKSWKEWSESR